MFQQLKCLLGFHKYDLDDYHTSINGYVIFWCKKCDKAKVISPKELIEFKK